MTSYDSLDYSVDRKSAERNVLEVVVVIFETRYKETIQSVSTLHTIINAEVVLEQKEKLFLFIFLLFVIKA